MAAVVAMALSLQNYSTFVVATLFTDLRFVIEGENNTIVDAWEGGRESLQISFHVLS